MSACASTTVITWRWRISLWLCFDCFFVSHRQDYGFIVAFSDPGCEMVQGLLGLVNVCKELGFYSLRHFGHLCELA